jgi:Leucine-rich repeat (LRR) protein
MVEALINGGADINAIMRPSILCTVNTDLTALFQAAMANNIQMVRFLLQNGATDARLKALTRVLRIPHNDVAGLLLCHNGNVTVDSATMELRKRNNQETLSSPSLLVVNWASKKLNYIDESWLNLVLVESPVPKKCHVISQLNLSDNNLNDLPLAIFQLEHLVRLELSRNKIDFLPDSDWNCPKLNHFDVSHNQLSSLPMVLFTLPMLKELLCNNNTLRDLPMEFWLAPKLKKLQLQKNQLEFFPSPLPPLGDSGISTMDNLPESTLYSSSSLPEYSFSYSSSPLNNRTQVLKRNRISTSPSQSNQTMPMNDRRISLPAVSAASNLLPSRLRELFLDNNEEDDIFEELSPMDANETKETDNLFQLESLDLSHNLLTAIPQDLCCLAPKLQKLQLHHNKLKSLGTISNYPADLELLDACHNQLTGGIGCALSRENLRNTVCAQKLLQLGVASDSTTPTRCLHRHHKNMRKLSYLKIANNSLMDIQLFRMIDRERHSSDLTSSIDEMRLARRPSRAYAELSYYQRDLSKSSSGLKSSTSSNEEGSNEIKKESSAPVGQEIAYCLYPQLSTLDIASNRLSSVPSHIELISSLSILNISYNVSIDVLPLQLSNLEGLWSLEYDGVPLTNPPASDLDKFRSAADKLLYMRSLLHDAKPYESMKLMLVGLQKQGKTTLLSRLREINEAKTAVTTYNDRIERESVSVTASVKPTSFFRKILSKDGMI